MRSVRDPRLAVIGCGAVVDHHLIPALKRIGWLPSVLIDPSPARIDTVARRMGAKGKAAVRGADWRELTGEFEAALVAAPHALHAPIGLGLLESGKHIFMEKPLATTHADCGRLTELADAKGLVLTVGLLRRHLRIARWTKALLEAGVLGPIQRFEAREGFVFNWATSTVALLDRALAGGGVLMDTGAHTLDQLSWWLGEVDTLTYRDDAQGGVEADCLIECRMLSGANGRIELSRSRELRNSCRITGTKGFVEVHLFKNEVICGSPNALGFVHDGIGAADMEPQFFPALFDAELGEFAKAVRTGAKVSVSASEATRSVALIERCYGARQALPSPWADGLPRSPGSIGTDRPRIAARTRVLITGATGFIGGRLAETLMGQGADVRCLVRNFGTATRLARMRPEFIAADLASPEAVDQAVAGMDLVIHCAYDPRSRKQNMAGLTNIIDAALRHNVRRLVHVSTFSVYEPFADGRLDETTSDGDRGWTYVKNKLDLEAMLLAAVRERGLAAAIVQPTIVYGPFAGSWTNGPAENLLYGKVVLPEDAGLCNAVYIDDLVDGLILAATRDEAVGERFILSGPEPITWHAFFDGIAAALGTARAERWPTARIAASNQGLIRDLKLVAANPKKIIQILVRQPTMRQVLQAGLDALPERLKGLVMKHYFGSGGRRPGGIVLPDPQQLRLFAAKAWSDNEKARRLIGYAPAYEFAAGMEPTRRYLEWAYGDMKKRLLLAEPPDQAIAGPRNEGYAR